MSLLAAAGLHYSRAGIIVQRSVIGSFWMRLLVFSILALPFSYCIYRFKVRQEIENELHRTICPVCGRAGEEPVGTKRECGEGLVPQSAMKWIDEDDPGHSV